MEIRSFRENDKQAVIALWGRCNLTVPWNDPERDLRRKEMVQPELFLVGWVGSALIASVMGGYDGHRGWLYYLSVDPDYQGNGYGRAIVEAAELRIAALGCPKINLMVRKTNTEVIGFYQRLGYNPDEVVCLGKRLTQD